jgi:hypothetical protein
MRAGGGIGGAERDVFHDDSGSPAKTSLGEMGFDAATAHFRQQRCFEIIREAD